MPLINKSRASSSNYHPVPSLHLLSFHLPPTKNKPGNMLQEVAVISVIIIVISSPSLYPIRSEKPKDSEE